MIHSKLQIKDATLKEISEIASEALYSDQKNKNSLSLKFWLNYI